MQDLIDTIWTTEQTALTVLFGAGAVIIAMHRPLPNHADKRAVRKGLITVLGLVAAFVVIRGGNPVGYRPDSWSDANIIVSGRNYARLGLRANALAPQHQVVSAIHPNDPFYIYTQYPFGTNFINGLWQRAGVTSERIFRFIPGLCSLLALIVWYRIFERFGDQLTAALATMVMATAYPFLAYADNLHFHGYGYLTTACCVFYYLKWADGIPRRTRYLIVSCGCALLGTFLTWENQLWLLLFVGMHGLLFRPVRWRRAWLLLFAVLVAGSVTPFVQRKLAYESTEIAGSRPDEALTTFLEDIHRRTIGFDVGMDAAPMDHFFIDYPAKVMLNFYCLYGIPAMGMIALLAALAFGGRARLSKPRSWPPHLRFLPVLIAAGMGWWCVMFQHTAVHQHVMRSMLPAVSWAGAMICLQAVQVIRSKTAQWRRVVAMMTMGGLAYAHFEGTFCTFRQHWTTVTFDERARYDGGNREGPGFAALREFVPPEGIILTNHSRLPLMRYWTDRPAYWCAATKVPPDGRWAFELSFNHLRELYQDRLPPLYFVYRFWFPSVEEAFSKDFYLRYFLIGKTNPTPDEIRHGIELVGEALTKGRNDNSFCPIVGTSGSMLCFSLDRALPRLREDFSKHGFPTLSQFGRPP